ncbi:hypothetical protein BC832DRAFT_537948 [Gaertneriomyces semiglobifer]|nr:hypothetical protein BC832DRAFT_537948 [Gaertneriomyces semiglobifer]
MLVPHPLPFILARACPLSLLQPPKLFVKLRYLSGQRTIRGSLSAGAAAIGGLPFMVSDGVDCVHGKFAGAVTISPISPVAVSIGATNHSWVVVCWGCSDRGAAIHVLSCQLRYLSGQRTIRGSLSAGAAAIGGLPFMGTTPGGQSSLAWYQRRPGREPPGLHQEWALLHLQSKVPFDPDRCARIVRDRVSQINQGVRWENLPMAEIAVMRLWITTAERAGVIPVGAVQSYEARSFGTVDKIAHPTQHPTTSSRFRVFLHFDSPEAVQAFAVRCMNRSFCLPQYFFNTKPWIGVTRAQASSVPTPAAPAPPAAAPAPPAATLESALSSRTLGALNVHRRTYGNTPVTTQMAVASVMLLLSEQECRDLLNELYRGAGPAS